MSIAILATKLYIPPLRPSVVRRPRLIDRLTEGLHHKLTLISAPAGFGKTTLVSEWVDDLRFTISDLRSGRKTTIDAAAENQIVKRVAWLSLDEGDSDLVRFLTYLVAALQTVKENIGADVLRSLQSPQPPPATTILTALLNEIAAAADHFILVLDDYHLIDAAPPGRPLLGTVDDALAFLLEHLPPTMHLVITTREDPSLPLARYRARGQLTEVRAADLRFTPAEAADFLKQVMNLELAPQEIAALEARTEGWVAGLQLAALSMQRHQDAGHDDIASFIKSFTGSHRFVMDYLVEEVLHQQPVSVQTFLLRTSILDRLCGPLCDALLEGGAEDQGNREAIPASPFHPFTPASAGQATLEALELANLFIVPLDNERGWYRYHHLFADLLRQRLHQSVATAAEGADPSVAELHRRASLWYEANGLEIEAFHHALAAEDFERAAALVELAWQAMDRSRQAATWLSWVQALPDELVRARPVLSVGYASALLDSGELEAAVQRLQDAERWLGTLAETSQPPPGALVADEEEFRSLSGTIAAARAYHAQAVGDTPGAVQYARQALDRLPAGDYLRRGTPAALLGLAYWNSGDLKAAYDSLRAAMTNYEQAGNLLFAITGAHVLADILLAQGRLREAVRTYDQSLQLATAQGDLVLRGAADLYTRVSELYREQGNLAAADQHMQRSEALGKDGDLPRWRYRWCIAQARIKEAEGDLDGALDLLNEAERVYVRGPVPDVRPIAALKARVLVAQGRLAEAQGWAREQKLAVDDELSYLREFEHITLARLLIAQYKIEQTEDSIHMAVGLLARLLQAAEVGGRTGAVIEILLLQALAHAAQGNIQLALAPLERSLTLAEPEGYVRTFVDERLPMAQLLSAAAEHGIMRDYVDKLLAAFDGATADAQRTPAAGEDSVISQPAELVEPLSQRELEVLQLVAQGLTNRAISERLFVALDTVKGHNRRIFGKLQVRRRTEAVARARELGLV